MRVGPHPGISALITRGRGTRAPAAMCRHGDGSHLQARIRVPPGAESAQDEGPPGTESAQDEGPPRN